MDVGLRGLRREVMTPRRPSSSAGLIAVSTLAMVFAVSSSLLLFSAHRHRAHRDQLFLDNHARIHRVQRDRMPALYAPTAPPANGVVVTPSSDCKGPVYRPTSDGRTEVVFEQCPARPFAASR